jgi:hypothetical protein
MFGMAHQWSCWLVLHLLLLPSCRLWLLWRGACGHPPQIRPQVSGGALHQAAPDAAAVSAAVSVAVVTADSSHARIHAARSSRSWLSKWCTVVCEAAAAAWCHKHAAALLPRQQKCVLVHTHILWLTPTTPFAGVLNEGASSSMYAVSVLRCTCAGMLSSPSRSTFSGSTSTQASWLTCNTRWDMQQQQQQQGRHSHNSAISVAAAVVAGAAAADGTCCNWHSASALAAASVVAA